MKTQIHHTGQHLSPIQCYSSGDKKRARLTKYSKRESQDLKSEMKLIKS